MKFIRIVDNWLKIQMFGHVNSELRSNRLVKHNIWYDLYPYKNQLKPINVESYKENIKLVKAIYTDNDKPIVYDKRVYQLCFRDWDNDLILKDDWNGVKIMGNLIANDGHEGMTYEVALCELLPDHKLNEFYQIEYMGEILNGKTQDLQAIVDLYYWKKSYI